MGQYTRGDYQNVLNLGQGSLAALSGGQGDPLQVGGPFVGDYIIIVYPVVPIPKQPARKYCGQYQRWNPDKTRSQLDAHGEKAERRCCAQEERQQETGPEDRAGQHIPVFAREPFRRFVGGLPGETLGAQPLAQLGLHVEHLAQVRVLVEQAIEIRLLQAEEVSRVACTVAFRGCPVRRAISPKC